MSPAEANERSFKNVVMSSLRWAALGRFGAQIITWVITIVVIRILSPADYGLMALASLVTSVFAVFEGLGMTAALIQKKNLAVELIQKIFAATMLIGALVFVLIYLISPYIAAFFGEPRLSEIIRVMAATIPISAVGALPLALIQKELLFKRKSVVEFIAAALSSVSTLVLAMQGYEVWSLVFGSICLALVKTVGYWSALGKLYVPNFDFRNIKDEVKFGGFVSLDRLIWLFYSQADVFFIGKFLGKEVLGVYSVAMQLAALPMKKIVGILNEVGFSAFARIQSDPKELARALLKAVGNLALVAFPVFLGISAVAPNIVEVVLDEKWVDVAVPLALLALVIPLRLINTTTPTLLYSIGRADVAAQNGFLALIIMVPAFAAAAAWGSVTEVCLVWLILYPVYYFICLSRLLHRIDVRMLEYFRQIGSYAAAAVAMYLSVRIASDVLSTGFFGVIGNLVLLIVLGAIVYTGILWLVARERLVEFVELVRN